MRKLLDIDPYMVYVDDWEGFDLYLSDSDHYQDSLEDFLDVVKDDAEFKVENGGVIKIYTCRVKNIQYHFPTINDNYDLSDGTAENFLDEVRNYIFEDIQTIHDDYIEVEEKHYDIKGEDELKEAYLKKDIKALSEALEAFRKANEHLHFYSPVKNVEIHEFTYESDGSIVKLVPVI